MAKEGKIVKVSGPLVEALGMQEAKMYDVVKVGEQRLIGEIIRLSGERAYIQVYEETEGLGPGDPVFLTGEPLVVELGPGLLDSIYDGIQRPLGRIREEIGDYIGRGLTIHALPRKKKWNFKPLVKKGELVKEGDILGKVEETPLIEHRVLVPPGINGKVESIKGGSFTIEEEIAKIEKRPIRMLSRWPVRNPRPFKERLAPVVPLVTGQRIIDSLFPVAKGGTACIPGPFGSGKTVVLHEIAKWANSQIIVYTGCGERGNEMADVLLEFPKLKDPKSGRPLTERTILIANTSNM
ncbi:MAG: V-type ATP synthase subunit A, partial [Candidatus Omnitrophica bacterium]|nr:V-type ATP synthase subunit A [Candidatus Omnitrophota bacterium]